MSLLDGLLRLTRPYSEDEEDDIDNGFITRQSRDNSAPSLAATSPDMRNAGTIGKIQTLHTTTQLQVVLMKPDRFESAVEVADHLRDRHTVVLNLESANKDVSRRLIDFLSGVAYALEGKVKKVANSTYIITPYNVNILGDLLDELESSGVYF